jgi:hypothetical protein
MNDTVGVVRRRSSVLIPRYIVTWSSQDREPTIPTPSHAGDAYDCEFVDLLIGCHKSEAVLAGVVGCLVWVGGIVWPKISVAFFGEAVQIAGKTNPSERSKNFNLKEALSLLVIKNN